MHKTLQVDGAELPYDIDGSGHPLILVHAGIADRRMWDAQVRAFAPHYQVVRYDWRGCGQARTRPTECIECGGSGGPGITRTRSIVGCGCALEQDQGR